MKVIKKIRKGCFRKIIRRNLCFYYYRIWCIVVKYLIFKCFDWLKCNFLNKVIIFDEILCGFNFEGCFKCVCSII